VFLLQIKKYDNENRNKKNKYSYDRLIKVSEKEITAVTRSFFKLQPLEW